MSTKFKLGDLKIDAQAYGSQGNAILGIRDSGKTYTATEIAEKLFDAGIPFITFDPTGVWRWLRVPGKGRGYPVVVAGGQAGDLPLTVSGAVEIVRASMQNGISLVLDLTDPGLSKANWKSIVKSCVRALLQENAPHGLRHIFIEEAAEFVPQRVLDGDVYAEVEKLARIGGNSRLGYTLINQRSQEVNKAVLELCENLFLHRQRGKNAIMSLDHWLDVAGVDRAVLVKSLPRLPSGQCWAWLGDREAPHLITVPPKNSFHPDRRTMRGAKAKRSRKAVDVGSFVKGLKATLVHIEIEAAANDPVKLKAEIARLKRELAVKPAGGVDPVKLKAAEQSGYQRGKVEGYGEGLIAAADDMRQRVDGAMAALRKALVLDDATMKKWRDRAMRVPRKGTSVLAPLSPAPKPKPSKASNGGRPRESAIPEFTRPQQSVLHSLAMWRALGHDAPTRQMVAAAAGRSPKSGGFNNLVGSLVTAGAIGKPADGCLSLLVETDAVVRVEDGRGMLLNALSGPQRKLVDALVGAGSISREDLGQRTDYSASSGGFNNLVGSLASIGLIVKPSAGHVALSDWAQELFG